MSIVLDRQRPSQNESHVANITNVVRAVYIKAKPDVVVLDKTVPIVQDTAGPGLFLLGVRLVHATSLLCSQLS